ncbi:MAG TPA: 4Fe-4S binding protein [Firmicutes bacterium]|nr:4Fe-4S binding protein [Bacillota bacterium]
MSGLVNITIDGQKLPADPDKKLLWVALDYDIYIPHLCALPEMESPPAACRLCFVEVEGRREPVTACTLPVVEGMVVYTRSPRVDRLVASAFELLLTDHRLGCSKCPQNKRCALQKIARERKLKLKPPRLRALPKLQEIDGSLKNILFDRSRCVHCGRCIWACQQVAGVGAIGFSRRGYKRKVTTFGDLPLAESPCTECGQCVEVCPVGSFSYKTSPDPAGK